MTQVEVNEMLGFMRHVGAEITANNAMPGGTVFFVEFLLDVGGNVLFNVVLFQRLNRYVDRIFLQLFAHVNILNDGFLLRLIHLESVGEIGKAKLIIKDKQRG